jgi:hypothetical protein
MSVRTRLWDRTCTLAVKATRAHSRQRKARRKAASVYARLLLYLGGNINEHAHRETTVEEDQEQLNA